LANGIRVVVDVPNSTLIPFATEQQGAKIVVLPMAFVRLACQLSLATYLKVENVQSEGLERAARTAAACLDVGSPLPGCLIAFGNDLAAHYRAAFAKEPPRGRNLAFGLFHAALWQIAQHEYAHHYLEHFTRIGAKQISRIDAEFEADLYAVTNGVQAGDAVSGMYYVFDRLADVEKATTKLSTPLYESGRCRAGNVDNITAFVGIVPIVLLDAAGGGRTRLASNSPAILREIVGEHFGGSVPTLKAGSCGLIARVELGKTYGELKQLSARMATDAELLFSKRTQIDDARASRLIGDLSAMTQSFRYADGIASKSIAFMLRNWGLKGRGRTPIMGEVERLLENDRVIANLQSEDYGRLLSSQALAVLQERVDLPAQTRLDRSFRILSNAVYYNPLLSEAWMNLAFISFRRGDCVTAARYARSSRTTHDPEDKAGLDVAASFVQAMEAWSADPATCKAQAARFQPYPGL
jgi:hypothetical protein